MRDELAGGDGAQCIACGHRNRLGAAFCGNCAASLASAGACAHCGGSNPAQQKFCDTCGKPIGGAEPPAPTPARNGAGAPVAFARGRYVVQRFLGEGGKKRVYLAHDHRLDRDVACALIKSEGLDEAGRARVRREAQAMGRLGGHPHIVTVYDIGEENDQPFIVSQYMGGGSLDNLLDHAEHRRLTLPRALRLAEQVCEALEHAHQRGVVHRDLKPSNVWLTEDGTAKLGDFGLALALDRSRLTVEGMMVGTVAYMPPEQALGRAADARSDLYALGAVLYEMVTGRPPFLGDDAVAIISQHINTPPVAPSWHNPEVPRALEALILRLLAKPPEERPESAAVVREALAAISSLSVSATTTDRVTSADTNPLDRLAGGVFVGREREIDELRAGLEESLSGRGRLFMLVGEPGIGKTRTAEELITYARLRKAQALWGRCYEGDGAPAYWPWVQAIRSYVHDGDPKSLLSEMGSGAAIIGQVVSEVRERLPGLPEPPSLTPEQGRFRLFDSVTTFLKNAANRQPLVLVLDDLHWADKASLLLLQFLAREMRSARLLVIGTYRDVDLRRQHPLSQALGELNREQLSQRIVLRGLTEHDVARFIEVTAGLKPPEGLVTAVYKETEGNPFFVNEVVRLLVSERRLEHADTVKSWSVSIPQGVREVVGRRLDHVSAACNEVLTIASVIGREFGVDALERVSGLSGDRLLEVLEEAEGARVIVEVPRTVGRYSFSHALVRETLYEELTTTRRVRLHRQVGEALEAFYGAQPEAHLSELAHHFFEAAQGGDVDRAIAYAMRAGDRAAGMMAHEEATRQYEIALQALDLREHSDEGRCAVLLTLNETLWRGGEYVRAKEIALEAAAIARRLGTSEQLARAALGFGGRLIAFAAVIRDETLIGLLEEALAALGEEESTLRALVLGRLAEEITISDPYERRESLCRQAVEMARRLGDPVVLSLVLRNTHWALWTAENVEERLVLADEIIHLAGESGDRTMVIEGHAFRLWDRLELGDVSKAQREYETVAGSVEELRQPYISWALDITRVLFALVQGRLAEAEALAQRALHIGQEAQNQNSALVFMIHMMTLLREQGRLAELEPSMGALDIYPSIAPNVLCAKAVLCCDAQNAPEARALFERLAVNDFAIFPRNLAQLFSLAYLSEVCAFLGDVARARTLYEMLLPFAHLNVMVGPATTFGAVSRHLALLASTLGERERAARLFEHALEMNARMETRQALARTQIEYAELLLAGREPGDRTRALELLRDGLDNAQALGMKLVVERGLAMKLRAQGVTAGSLEMSIDAVVSSVQRERPDLRGHTAPDGTVTILFSDIEGSTAMTERLGDRRAQEVLRAHNAIVREHVAAHGGFEVKSQGDGFMIAFQSARRALRCAIEMQRAFAGHAERHPATSVRVRIGLHTGEPVKEADDFFGQAVILAARIAAQAEGGEILVSSLIRELAESTGEFTFAGVRPVQLKGLSGTREVSIVAW
jgi:eukaryotic-like serine/threonine-protein kinase